MPFFFVRFKKIKNQLKHIYIITNNDYTILNYNILGIYKLALINP